MQKRKIKVILDTNWYISATISKKSRRILYKLLTNKQLVLVYADELLQSYQSGLMAHAANVMTRGFESYRLLTFFAVVCVLTNNKNCL